jgi:hypothetical protein
MRKILRAAGPARAHNLDMKNKAPKAKASTPRRGSATPAKKRTSAKPIKAAAAPAPGPDKSATCAFKIDAPEMDFKGSTYPHGAQISMSTREAMEREEQHLGHRV